MRQIYMQKTQWNASLFCKFFIYFLHMNLAHFSVFFAGKCAGNCMAIFHIFRAFSWWFFMECVRGWERRDPGKIPVKMRQSRSGFHWKNSFLQRDVNEKRNWRESWKIPLVTSSAAAESEMKGRVELFIPYFSSFLMIILKTMWWDWVGWDCETVIPEKPLTPRSNRNHPV